MRRSGFAALIFSLSPSREMIASLRSNFRHVPMSPHVLVWDIETVPDIKGFAAANGHDGKSDEEIRAAIGDKFPKHLYHSIICIGALIAHRDNDHWVVDALGAPHVGERPEKDNLVRQSNRRTHPAACDLQWDIVRPSRPAISRNDAWRCSAGVSRSSIF